MRGIIFDHQKELEAKIEINNMNLKLNDSKRETSRLIKLVDQYEETIILQSKYIQKLSDFIDETNELMKKELDIARSDV